MALTLSYIARAEGNFRSYGHLGAWPGAAGKKGASLLREVSGEPEADDAPFTQGLQALAAQGLHGLHAGFRTAQGLQGLHGLQALAAQGLHGLQALAAQGLHGLQAASCTEVPAA
jgi:hypothetical protein